MQMADTRILPVGIDSFEKIRKCGFCYVDKTNLIEQLLESWEEVNQLTRSRDGKESMQMAEPIKLPVGIESFSEIRETGFYYVDKTKLVEQLLDQWGKVNLFTRPRRFGKTLNMSMLRNFLRLGQTNPCLMDCIFRGTKSSARHTRENTPSYFFR